MRTLQGPFVKCELTVARKIEGELSGEYDHVAFVEVPPFNGRPDVLIWGQRTFIPIEPADNACSRYMEAFAYYVAATHCIQNDPG